MTANIFRPFESPTPESVREFINNVPLYRGDDDPTFWGTERLRTHQEALLRKQIELVGRSSPYYREKFAAAGMDAGDIRTVDDLAQLPVTTKADLMADPESFKLHIPMAGLYDRPFNTIYTTGTTTGRPTPYVYTSHDFMGVMLASMRSFKAQYALPGDKYFSVFPLSPVPHVAMFPALTASAAGLYFISGLTGSPYPEFPVHRSSADVLSRIESLRPQIITGIASFLRRLFIEAAERKSDLSSIYLVIPSGESLTDSMREKMHECLAACGAEHTWIGAGYGFTEGGLPWTCCHENGALHTIAPDQVYLEILDPITRERQPDGRTGLVAITHLNRRGMPLVRYLLGDLGAITNERCEYCGREVQSLLISCGSAHISRTNDLIKIKGVLVNPECIHDVVFNTPGVLEYRVTLENRVHGDPDSGDILKVFVALEHPTAHDPAHPQPWIDELRAAVFNASEVHPEVVIVAHPNEIYDPERNFKAKRFLDQRAPRAHNP